MWLVVFLLFWSYMVLFKPSVFLAFLSPERKIPRNRVFTVVRLTTAVIVFLIAVYCMALVFALRKVNTASSPEVFFSPARQGSATVPPAMPFGSGAPAQGTGSVGVSLPDVAGNGTQQ
jgi:hypothetical protein